MTIKIKIAFYEWRKREISQLTLQLIRIELYVHYKHLNAKFLFKTNFQIINQLFHESSIFIVIE